MRNTKRRDTFETWMAKVNAACISRCGASAEDLADVCYRDLYDDGVGADAAARKAIKYSMEN